MSNGLSLHIGLNFVDPQHYAGWDGELVACEFDAEDMEIIASASGYTTKKLLTKDATRDAVLSSVKAASEKMESGDIFLLTYSGHGGSVKDLGGDERDFQDETWCLYDGQLLDDEIKIMLCAFPAGSRILVLSDSCHSGTVVRNPDEQPWPDYLPDPSLRYRFMPRDVAGRTYRKNMPFYEQVQNELPSDQPECAASVRLISGCQDNQYSLDGDFNGRFTGSLLRVWNNGNFSGNYDSFHREIRAWMPPTQTPNHFRMGANDPDYDRQRPFLV